MNYKGKPLHKYPKQDIIDLCESLVAELRMCGGTVPEDLKKDDIADWVPPEDEDWNPPRVAAILYKGKGKPGGK